MCMNEQKNSIPSAKLISHVLIDFSSEAEMELFINYVEKTGVNFYENMKKIGLMRFRLNQVWNKEGGFALSTLFEYKDENAYVKGQKVIEKHFTLDRKDGGVDSEFSLEPAELKMLVDESKRAFKSIGKIFIGITEEEKSSLRFKRSIYVVNDMKKNEKFLRLSRII